VGPPTVSTRPWPAGDAALAPADWGPQVDREALSRLLDAAFEGAGDPAGANARGVAIVHRGRLLADRGAPGFAPGTPLHGWSMTKTVTGMLAHQLAADGRIELGAPVVDAFGRTREPAWAPRWRADGRARIRVDDLLHMRDGLAHEENYAPWGSVPRMLWGGPDVAAFAADAPLAAPPGERWRYLSASTNLLARVLRSRFERDDAYWAYPRTALFDPIGARTAVLETDGDGTWIGSSYLWASTADWARLGWLMARDGRWEGRQVLAPGWLARAAAPAMADGEGRGYGAQTWRFGDAQAGRCRGLGLPEDLIAMSGHWGQIVAIVPSREVVIVRLGWTFDRSRFDPCAFVSQVLATLR
jgi:CubicO group peptidase (beta-lactamase class C family)